ncbi:MAG: rhamnogalacturonan acetylesterase [Prolixibacteraceae bacterium]|jgi:DNA sulfur modification protein DndE|nr:rhamnogalacturonan acetylesterase [Prolixibacteraceae bacterium]
MKNLHIILFLLFAFMSACSTKENTPTVHMIGDSTMANKPDPDYPERGWGQVLPDFFDSTQIIINYARNGRSTRSFIYESLWDTVYSKLQPGDYVIIQFGHNDDVVSKVGRHSTLEEYEYNLSKFVRESQAKGAHPILCTPIVRRNFNENSVLIETHGEYPDIVRKVASFYDVPLVDMHYKSRDLVRKLGVEKSIPLYLHFPANTYEKAPDGKKDNTHFNENGAKKMASFFVDYLTENDHKLAKHINKKELEEQQKSFN